MFAVECAEPLAQSIGEILQQQELVAGLDEASQGEGVQFLIRMEDNFGHQADRFVSAFMKSLQRRFPSAELIRRSVVPNEAMKLKSDEVSLTLSAQVERIESASWESSVESSSGDIVCQIATDGNTTDVKARFANKPWVTRFDEVVSKFPNRRFVVGYSSELTSSESQARQSALENVRSQIDVTYNGGGRFTIADEHVVDRFAQKLSRPYRDVWREAVLVDLTEKQIQLSAAVATGASSQRLVMKRLSVLFASLLVLATVVVCFHFNVLTQGYYRKPINRSAVTLIVLVVLGGLLLLGLNVA